MRSKYTIIMTELNSLDHNHLSSETSQRNSWKEETLHMAQYHLFSQHSPSTLILSSISFANMRQGFAHVQFFNMLLFLPGTLS